MLELSKRNQGLDILRAVAILSVVFLHSLEFIPNENFIFRHYFEYGWAGVDLFFVLSGFLIGRQVFTTEEEQPLSEKLTTFWIKRWFRTFPLYFLVLFVYVVIKPLAGFRFVDFNFNFFFFLQNYTEIKDFVQSWSLCIEEQFYLLFPILAFGFAFSKRTYVWILPMVISLVFRYYFWQKGWLDGLTRQQIAYMIDFPTHTHLDGISMGVVLAKTFPIWSRWTDITKKILGILAILFIVTTLYLSGPYLQDLGSVFCFTSLSIGFSLLLIAIYKVRIHNVFYIPVTKIAEWSYGMYLWNNFVARLMIHLGPNVNWWLKISIFILLTCLLAAISFYTVEKPFLKIRNNLLSLLKTRRMEKDLHA